MVIYDSFLIDHWYVTCLMHTQFNWICWDSSFFTTESFRKREIIEIRFYFIG